MLPAWSIRSSTSKRNSDGISGGSSDSMYIDLTFTRLSDMNLGIMWYYGRENLAFDNVAIDGGSGQSQFDTHQSGDTSDYHHVYINNVQMPDEELWFDDRDSGRTTQWTEVLVKNCKALVFGCPNPIRLRNNVLTNATPVADQN